MKLINLRKIIREEIKNTVGDLNSDDVSLISIHKLKLACPAAAESAMNGVCNIGHEVDHNDVFWVMTKKPYMISDGTDKISSYGGYDFNSREEWTETNEPELASDLADDWESIACDVNGRKVVFLCGSEDDEYGYYWNNSDQQWVSYSF